MGSESKTKNKENTLSRKRTINKSRRSTKKKLVNVLKKLHAKEENSKEECRKVLINKSFVGNY